MLGEQGQAAFTILNEGALQVQFEISSGGQVSIHSYNAAHWCPCRAVACDGVSAEPLPAIGIAADMYSAIACLQTCSLQGCSCRGTACHGVSAELLPARVFLQRRFCRAIAYNCARQSLPGWCFG